MARVPLQPETRAARALSLTVTTLMVGLGVVALAAAIALKHVEESWRAALTGRWTLELPLPDAAQSFPQADLDRVLAALRGAPGVIGARVLGPDEIGRLLRPWLGDNLPTAELPLPALVDLEVDAAHPPAPAALEQLVVPINPGARVDDHGAWTRDLARLAHAGELGGLGLFATIVVIMMLVIAAAARARMAINRPEIELLHSMGADDAYVAHQFQAGAFRLALVGALLGSAVGAGAIWGLLGLRYGFALLVPRVYLLPLDFVALAVVPVMAMLLATLVSRWAALAMLGPLP